jgi:DNA-binding SARP family transcriptional activator
MGDRVIGPPDGTLTLLLTDVEGSTALREQHPEAMRSALARHDGILQALATLHRGQGITTTGDHGIAAFDGARAALDAALAIRQVVGATSWGALGTLPVRIALHTGPARLRDGEYVGEAVDRVLWLLSIAEGGQILASQATVTSLGNALPDGLVVRSLGGAALPDVPPFPVFAVEAASAPASDREPEDPSLRVYTLGEFRVEYGGRVIAANQWGGSKGRQIFKYLVTRRTRRLPRSEAYELFFPDSADAAQSTLRSTLHRLRNVLKPDRGHDESPIVLTSDGVAVRPGVAVWIDAEELERLIAEARHADDPLPLLEGADRLYVGDYLAEDMAEEWAAPRRESLRQQWIELQLELARVREQRGDMDGAVAALQRVLARDACDERVARELMLLLARHGRRAEALRVFQRLADALRADLDVSPTDETLEARATIAAEASADDPPMPPGAVGPRGVRRLRDAQAIEPPSGVLERLTGERLTGPSPVPSIWVAAPAPVAPPPQFRPSYPFPSPDLLVGRQRELLSLRRLLERGRTGGQVALIGAPAGSGKSALVGALLEHARSRGFLTLAGGSYDRQGLILFGPIRDALADYLLSVPAATLRGSLAAVSRDLARIVPELGAHLGLPSEAAASENVDTGRLFGAVHACLRLLAATQPVVLCLEDLHAVDDATLALLHFIARMARTERLVLVCTYRTDEVQPGQPLGRTLATLAREGLSESLSLRTLDQDETTNLVSALLDGPPSSELSAALYATSEGNPLFVEQLILSLREDDLLLRQHGVWQLLGEGSARLSPIIREVIERRFGRLSAHCREMLEVASVIGSTFEYPVLTEARRERDDELVTRDLDEAIRAQVIHETATGFAFGHAMLREALYHSLSRPLRGLLHARVGSTIERLAGPRAGEQAAELARHFSLAAHVAPTAARALGYSLEAGRRAVNLGAHREALSQYARACDFAERHGDDDAESRDLRIEALEGRAWAERQLGMWLACSATCRTILALSTDPIRRARIRSMICRALRSLGDTQQSLDEAADGLAELEAVPETDDSARVRIQLLYDRAFLGHLLGRFREVEAMGRLMLGLADAHPEPVNEFMACSILALACMSQGRDAEAVEQYRRAVAAAERAHDLIGQAVFHENLGKQHHLAGRFADATAELERAIALYQDAAAGPRAVNAIHRVARVRLSQGEVEVAQRQADLALSRALDGQDRWAAECHDVLGAIHALLGAWDAAEASYERALAIRERVGHADGIVESLVGLATVYERRGDWRRAESFARRARDVASAIDPCPIQVRPLRLLGRLYGRLGDAARAAEVLDAALALAQPMAPTVELVPTLLVCAEERQRHGDPAAFDLLRQALGADAEAEARVELCAYAARLWSAQGDVSGARAWVEEALRLAGLTGSTRLLGLAELARAGLQAAERAPAPAGLAAPASEAFEEALRLLDDAAVPYDLATAMREYGRVLVCTAGREARGRALLEAAQRRFEQLGAGPDAAACRVRAEP